MKQYLTILLLLLLPLVTQGQTKKSEPLFEQAVEKSIVDQYEEAVQDVKAGNVENHKDVDNFFKQHNLL